MKAFWDGQAVYYIKNESLPSRFFKQFLAINMVRDWSNWRKRFMLILVLGKHS
jgi:hypothetical protein